MNRGRSRERIFLDDDDVFEFLDITGDTVERFGIEVHAYSLMPNHYHLLIRSPLGNLSGAMKHLGAVYTQGFNRRYRRDGALFRGRFKSQVVKYEPYLIYVLAYIHLNPLKAGLINRLDALRGFTSYRAYLGRDQDPEWLTTDVLGSLFETPEEMKELVLRLRKKTEPWPKGIRQEDGWFMWHLCPVDIEQGEGEPDTMPIGIPIDEVLQDICDVTGVGMSRLTASIRGPGGNPERRFAVWALQNSTYLTYRQIGEQLGMTAEHVARDVRRNRGGIERFSEWTTSWTLKYPQKVSVLEA